MQSFRRLPALSVALIALAAAAGCATGSGAKSAPAPAQPAGNVDEARLKRFFAIMDQDGSGVISRPEFQSGKGMVFMAIDADGSLTLTQDEMRLTPEAFNLLSGGDGVVDGEEFLAGEIAGFDAIDANQDHELTYAELRDYLAKYE
jgi:hypothetical protein